jgi:hypothetical protein
MYNRGQQDYDKCSASEEDDDREQYFGQSGFFIIIGVE